MYDRMRHPQAICILVGWRGINRNPAVLTAASYRSISHYKKKKKKTTRVMVWGSLHLISIHSLTTEPI